MRNIPDKIHRKNQNIRFISNNFFFFRKSCLLWDDVEKYCRAGHTKDDNMAHAHCMLDTQGYKNTLGMCNIYCSSPATMVAKTQLSVTLYAHCLSNYFII